MSLTTAELLINKGATFAVPTTSGSAYTINVNVSGTDLTNLTAAQQNNLTGVLDQLATANVQNIKFSGAPLTGADYIAIKAWDTSHATVSISAQSLALVDVAGTNAITFSLDNAVSSIALQSGTAITVPFSATFESSFAKIAPSNLLSANLTVTEVTGAFVASVAGTASVDRFTIKSGESIAMTADQWASFKTNLSKVDLPSLTNASVTVTGVTAAGISALTSDTYVDAINVATGTSITAAYSSTWQDAFSKVTNLGDASLKVTGVLAGNNGAKLLDVAQNTNVDQFTVANNQTLSLTNENFGILLANAGKVVGNGLLDATVNVSGVPSASVLTAIQTSWVDAVTVNANAKLSITSSQYNNAEGTLYTQLQKIQNGSDFKLTVTDVTAGLNGAVPAALLDPMVDVVKLADGQNFVFTKPADYASAQSALATKGVADYTVEVQCCKATATLPMSRSRQTSNSM
jgi:hypothetical protein